MNEQDYIQLTLFPEDSPVSRSPLPGSGEARKMTATSGRKWLGLSKNSGPLGLLEKMLLESLRWYSPIFYLNWKPVDIGQGHFLFQLALSEPDTDVTGWQSWPTPDTMCYRDGNTKRKEAKGRHAMSLNHAVAEEPKMFATPTTMEVEHPGMEISESGRRLTKNGNGSHSIGLADQVRMWPAPKSSMRGDCPSERARKSPDLSAAVKMFATPQARDYRTGQASRWEDTEHRSRNLNDQIAMFPTPTTGAGLCGGTGNFQQLKKLEENGVMSETERKNMSQGNGGQLNPDWVEWLQGFPIGWTEV